MRRLCRGLLVHRRCASERSSIAPGQGDATFPGLLVFDLLSSKPAHIEQKSFSGAGIHRRGGTLPETRRSGNPLEARRDGRGLARQPRTGFREARRHLARKRADGGQKSSICEEFLSPNNTLTALTWANAERDKGKPAHHPFPTHISTISVHEGALSGASPTGTPRHQIS